MEDNESDDNIYNIKLCRVGKTTLSFPWNAKVATSNSSANVNGHGCYEPVFKQQQLKEETDRKTDRDALEQIMSNETTWQG